MRLAPRPALLPLLVACGSEASGTWPGSDLGGEVVGTEHCGIVDTPQAWDRGGAPHAVSCDLVLRAAVTVEAGSVLTLAPGASIRVEEGGALVLDGDPCCPVELGPAEGEAWGPILVQGGSLDARWSTLRDGGGVVLSAGSATLDEVVITGAPQCALQVEGGSLVAAGLLVLQDAAWPACVAGPGLGALSGADLVIGGNGVQALRQDGGRIQADERWPVLPIRLLGPVEIGEAQLLLPAGARVEAGPAGLLAIGDGGELRAEGTAEEPVELTVADGETSWLGLRADEGASLVLDHVQVVAAGTAEGGAVQADGASVSFDALEIFGGPGVGLLLSGFVDLAAGGLSVRGAGGAPLALPAAAVGQLGSATLDLDSNALDAVLVATSPAVEGAVTWPAAPVPYLLSEDLVLAGSDDEPAHLLLDAGVRLAFGPGVALRVGEDGPAALQLAGTGSTPIVLGPWQDEGPGSWAGVVLGAESVDDDTTWEHFEVRAAGGAPLLGAVQLRGSSPTLRDGLVTGSAGYGLYLDADADPTLEAMVFEDNVLGDSNR